VKNILKTTTLLLLVFTCLTGAQAQRRKVIYLHNFNDAPYHWGFMLGVNNMAYSLRMNDDFQNELHTNYSHVKDVQGCPSENDFQSYQIINVEKRIKGVGFSVGATGDVRLGNYFNLRGMVAYCLGEDMDYLYTLQFNQKLDTIQVQVLSQNKNNNCIELPLHLKYRSIRYNNIDAYLIGGFSPKLYFSFKDLFKKENNSVNWIKTKVFDVAMEVGAGFDIYNQWFKLGIELKYSVGMLNLMSEEQVKFYGDPFKSLRNRQVMLSFTIE